MKITIVSSFFLPVPPVAGGAMEKIWFRLAREFAARGHIVSHVSRSWPGFREEETLDGVRMIRLAGYAHTRRLWSNLLLDLAWGLRVAFRLPGGDLVACNTVTLPVFLNAFNPQAGRVAVVLGRMPKGHAWFYGQVDRLIATSRAVREKVVKENSNLSSVTPVFPNPIDWHLHQSALASTHKPASGVTICYVGRMNPEKGLDILLAAAVELSRRPGLPAWRMRLVGPQSVAEGGGGEDYVESLRELAARSGAHVSIEPPVYRPEELARIYALADIFCYPSLAEKGEGLSVAPLEAMAAGAVPVLSALDCYDDLLVHGSNGLVFDHRAPDRAARLADAFELLLTRPETRARLSAAAQRDSRRFDYGEVAEALLADFAVLASPLDRGRELI